MWQFAIGLYFIHIAPESLFLAAVHGLVSSVTVFLAAPLIGRWIEKTGRMKEAKISLLLQNGGVAISALFVLFFELNLEMEFLKIEV